MNLVFGTVVYVIVLKLHPVMVIPPQNHVEEMKNVIGLYHLRVIEIPHQFHHSAIIILLTVIWMMVNVMMIQLHHVIYILGETHVQEMIIVTGLQLI
jgi:hypothetical protein